MDKKERLQLQHKTSRAPCITARRACKNCFDKDQKRGCDGQWTREHAICFRSPARWTGLLDVRMGDVGMSEVKCSERGDGSPLFPPLPLPRPVDLLARVSNPRPSASPAHFTNPKLAGAQPSKTSLPSTRHGCRALLFFVTSHPTPKLCPLCLCLCLPRLTALRDAQDSLPAVSLVCRRASPRPVHLHIRLADCQHSTTHRHVRSFHHSNGHRLPVCATYLHRAAQHFHNYARQTPLPGPVPP